MQLRSNSNMSHVQQKEAAISAINEDIINQLDNRINSSMVQRELLWGQEESAWTKRASMWNKDNMEPEFDLDIWEDMEQYMGENEEKESTFETAVEAEEECPEKFLAMAAHLGQTTKSHIVKNSDKELFFGFEYNTEFEVADGQVQNERGTAVVTARGVEHFLPSNFLSALKCYTGTDMSQITTEIVELRKVIQLNTPTSQLPTMIIKDKMKQLNLSCSPQLPIRLSLFQQKMLEMKRSMYLKRLNHTSPIRADPMKEAAGRSPNTSIDVTSPVLNSTVVLGGRRKRSMSDLDITCISPPSKRTKCTSLPVNCTTSKSPSKAKTLSKSLSNSLPKSLSKPSSSKQVDKCELVDIEKLKSKDINDPYEYKYSDFLSKSLVSETFGIKSIFAKAAQLRKTKSLQQPPQSLQQPPQTINPTKDISKKKGKRSLQFSNSGKYKALKQKHGNVEEIYTPTAMSKCAERSLSSKDPTRLANEVKNTISALMAQLKNGDEGYTVSVNYQVNITSGKGKNKAVKDNKDLNKDSGNDVKKDSVSGDQ